MSSASERVRRRFTSEEVLRMLEAGILHEDDAVELIDGELLIVSPQGPPHRGLSVVVHQVLEAAFGAGYHVQDHSPIDAEPHSMPEPDVAVVRGAPRDFLERHPAGSDVPLVVEVSVTSQAADRAKSAVYARAGVACYWHLDVPARRLHAYTGPRPEHAEYATVSILHEEDAAPLPTGGTVPVASLLP